jgi:hypothetical protein
MDFVNPEGEAPRLLTVIIAIVPSALWYMLFLKSQLYPAHRILG